MLEAKNTKKSEAKVSPSKDKPSRGQGPRTQAQVFSKKRSARKFFRRSPKNKVFKIIFQASYKIFNNSSNSAVFEPRTGQYSRT